MGSQAVLLSYLHLTVNQASVVLVRVQRAYTEPKDNIVTSNLRLRNTQEAKVMNTMQTKTT